MLEKLKDIFEKHKTERICVVGTTCCGKTTLLRQIPNCVDMDEALWPLLTQEEIKFVCQKPWTKEIGDFFDKLVYEKVKIQAGNPMFGTVILDCDVVVYLDVEDELLRQRCMKRDVEFNDAIDMKKAIEKDWNNHREQGVKQFYYLKMTRENKNDSK